MALRDEKGWFTCLSNSGSHTGAIHKIYYDPSNLEKINKIRKIQGKKPLASLHGYCMSTGCSCRNYDGSKGLPICGLFRAYDEDGIKKDFIHQLFGI